MAATDARTGTITRGFLFSDLRGYTQFVETHGAAAAADVLVRYRALVRDLVSRHAGAEIKTEGDSFYVVFDAVSDAVQCGLAIVDKAREASIERPEAPIAVGIGIHAGETIETPDGYVGGPVNIAARLCALAGPGEVLVSDTVRALTHTVLSVSFVPHGKKSLKGVSDPVAVFAVVAERPSLTAWTAFAGYLGVPGSASRSSWSSWSPGSGIRRQRAPSQRRPPARGLEDRRRCATHRAGDIPVPR